MHTYLIEMLECPACDGELDWEISQGEGLRIEQAEARCSQEPPALTPTGDTGHLTACFFPERVSGGVPLAALEE